MNVSVVICTCNRSANLRAALRSLAASAVPEGISWEAVVIDNNSSDDTRSVVESFGREYPGRFRYVFEPAQGKSHALNRAIQEAAGEIIAFTDDDVVVDPGWLSNLAAPLRDGRYAGAGGRTFPPEGFTAPRWLPVHEPHALAPLALFDRGPFAGELSDAPYGNNMAWRKDVFRVYEGFRTDLGPRHGSDEPQKGEDSEFGQRLIDAGERVWYEPSATLRHAVPPQRLNQRYFLAWSWDKARSDFHAAPNARLAGAKIAGVPPVLFRRLLRWTVQWMVTPDPAKRFACKMHMWTVAGTMHEWRRQRSTER
jgi:glucosyl-dolichyl phosphate glucuronosyltransferase